MHYRAGEIKQLVKECFVDDYKQSIHDRSGFTSEDMKAAYSRMIGIQTLAEQSFDTWFTDYLTKSKSNV